MAAPIVKSGLVIAFSKICGLQRREICPAKVLSLYSLLEGFRPESLSCIDSLPFSILLFFVSVIKRLTFYNIFTQIKGIIVFEGQISITYVKMTKKFQF